MSITEIESSIEADVPRARAYVDPKPEPESKQGRSLNWGVVLVLVLLFVIALGFRISRLSAIGFAEDEVNKVDAVEAYAQGNIALNAEHPMLMKTFMYASVHLASNFQNAGTVISDETKFRLPNAIIGALTVIPLFLLTAAFFDRWTGLLAAGFWAVGVNAITFNRIGKEDTLLVFFMLFAFYFYLRAKQRSPIDQKTRGRNYLLSGISFGLMLASKYFPHYFGLNSLYHHYFHVRKKQPGEPTGKTSRVFYIALIVAFLIANPPVLLPQVWNYLNDYMGEKLLVHSGYLFADHLYVNKVSSTPFGTPVYFYLLFMAIKIPFVVLISFIIGLVVSVKRRGHPAHAFVLFMFLLWIVPYSLIGAKWLRYTLSLMPVVYMLGAIGVIELIRFVSRGLNPLNHARTAAAAIVVAIFLGMPAWSAYMAGPHYALYTNALGRNHVGYFFAHDEFYDDGLREAIKFVCDTAPKSAVIAHETPAVARYYLRRFGREDLNSKAMSTPDFDVANVLGPAYIIVQRGRTYFENRDKISFVRAHFRKVHEEKIDGLTAAEVFVNEAP